jgi:Uma2 family endonuclease
MSSPTTETIRWTIADLELFPDDGKRYEIIDGELLVTRAPHWRHQKLCVRVGAILDAWSQETGLGEAAVTPGIVFSEADNVIPDVVWISKERLASSLDESGHLTAAPELVVEVLSQTEKDKKRDRQLKLKLYSSQGVREYWIFDPERREVEIYCRENARLKLTATLFGNDTLTSQLLPGFSCPVERIFS